VSHGHYARGFIQRTVSEARTALATRVISSSASQERLSRSPWADAQGGVAKLAAATAGLAEARSRRLRRQRLQAIHDAYLAEQGEIPGGRRAGWSADGSGGSTPASELPWASARGWAWPRLAARPQITATPSSGGRRSGAYSRTLRPDELDRGGGCEPGTEPDPMAAGGRRWSRRQTALVTFDHRSAHHPGRWSSTTATWWWAAADRLSRSPETRRAALSAALCAQDRVR
jgi:hypothetical protein